MAKAGEADDRQPSDHEVTKAIRKLSVEQTKELVYELGVELKDIDDIVARYSGNMAKAHLVKKWLDMDPNASWEKLVSALRDISMNKVAAKVERSNVRTAISDSTPSVSRARPADSRTPSYDHRERVLLCGNSNVGKTSLIDQFAEGRMAKTRPTVQAGFKVKTFRCGRNVLRIDIWDTPGQDRFAEFTIEPYMKVNGIMVIYDITNKKSFENVPKWMDKIKHYAARGVHVVLVGNKIDLENDRVVSREEGEKLAKKHGVRFFETSAWDNQCVEEPFMSLFSQRLEVLISCVQNEPRNKWCRCC